MDLLKDLEKIGAYLKTENLPQEKRMHFLLASGLHSNEFFHIKNLFTDPLKTEKCAQEFISRLEHQLVLEIEKVIGVAWGGAILAYEIARQLNLRCIFARDERFIAGEISKEEKVILVEDVITTGGSAKRVANALQNKYKAEILAVCTIIDRSGGKVTFYFPKTETEGEMRQIPLIALATRKFIAFKADQCPYCREKIPLVKL